MRRLRITIAALGVLSMSFGGWLAVTHLGLKSFRLGLWLAGPVIVHDALLVPLVLAGAWIARRVLPGPAWGPVVIGFAASGTLTALGAVVLFQPGADPTLPSLLDRNYRAGYAVALGSVWILTAGVAAVRVSRSRSRRQ
jgi:hypothetical protein